ncbi:hypothetical protein LJC40_07220, partial [Synergistaceae bacterium OttesenSCG-928-D05]|nr:hypothetical protein [Synergistaceae bacterium OttesenSCG-928-D05]
MAISRKVLLCVCVFVFSVLQPPAAQAGVVTYPSLDITGNGPTVSSDYTLRVTPGGIKMAGAEYAAGITLQKNASLDVAGSVEILNDSTRYFTGIDTEGGSIQVAGDVTLLARNGSGGNSAIDAGRDDWDIIDIGGSLIVSADSGTYSNSGIFAINTDVSIGRDILLSGGEKSRGVYMVGQWDETRRGILSVGGDVVVLNGVENTGVAIHDKVDGFLYKDLIVQGGQRSAGATVKGSGILTLYGDTIVAGGVRNTGVNTYYGGLANVFGDLSVGGTDSIGLHADWQGTINMTGGQVTADDSNIKGVFALTSEAAINLTDVSGGSVDTMLIWANGVDNTVTFSGSNLKGNVGHSAYYASDDWQGREGRLSITLSDDSTLTGAING